MDHINLYNSIYATQHSYYIYTYLRIKLLQQQLAVADWMLGTPLYNANLTVIFFKKALNTSTAVFSKYKVWKVEPKGEFCEIYI